MTDVQNHPEPNPALRGTPARPPSRLALFVLVLLSGLWGCGGSESGEGTPGGTDPFAGDLEGLGREGLPPVPAGLVLARAALAPDGRLLLVECAPDGRPRTAQPRPVADGTGGELSLLIRAFGAPRDGIPVWVGLQDDRVAELRIAVPEGAGCPPLLPLDAEVVASGNEPFWQIRILRGGATVVTPDNPDGVEYGEGAWTVVDGVWRYEAQRDFVDGMAWLTLDVFASPCIDDMSGGRFPWTVFVQWEGRELDGCAWEGGAHPGVRGAASAPGG